MRVRELRQARGWSQEDLAEHSGLSVRTIQRIERGGNPGLESLKRLAAVFEVHAAELQADAPTGSDDLSFPQAVSHCLRHYADFSGRAPGAEFWWFALAVALVVAMGEQIGPWLAALIATGLLLPLLAAATRRLRDAGQSPWWLLFGLVPVGGLVVLAVLLAMPSQAEPLVPDDAPRLSA